MRFLKVLSLSACFIFFANIAFAQAVDEKAATEKMIQFVKKTIEFAKKNGKEKTLAEINKGQDKEGLFVDGDLYIYAYDFNHTVIAHGVDKSLIGKNLTELKGPKKNPDGSDFYTIQELQKAAQKPDGGITMFYWPHPKKRNELWLKKGYSQKVDDTWWVGSGIYIKKAD